MKLNAGTAATAPGAPPQNQDLRLQQQDHHRARTTTAQREAQWGSLSGVTPDSQGEWLWLPSDIGVPIGARVKHVDPSRCLLVDDEGKERVLPADQVSSSSSSSAACRPMHHTSVEGVDDMIMLGDLTEAGLLRNLLVRHKHGLIYTYTGSVLVAVNPYKELPLYSNDQVKRYHGRKLGELPPHVFAIADSCYFNLTRSNIDHGQQSSIEQQILESNPILEGNHNTASTTLTCVLTCFLTCVLTCFLTCSLTCVLTCFLTCFLTCVLTCFLTCFLTCVLTCVLTCSLTCFLTCFPHLPFGNAKTIRNDNSSRFGKYLEIFFSQDGSIEGARVEQYLLEKSRVCHQAAGERNYHIFYCMLTGLSAEQKKSLCLTDAKAYKVLTQGGCVACDGRDDAKDFARILSAFKVLTFRESQCWEVYKLLAAILHLGNVTFEESVIKPLNDEQAADCRDAFVKELQQFFVWNIFDLEQQEYIRQGVAWSGISFEDNKPTLELLVGKPCNLLALIDEESHFPKGTDSTMLQKMNTLHKASTGYVASKTEHDCKFGIQHFAGVVYYDPHGFLEKNRDAISSDILKMINTSKHKVLRTIFHTELSVNGVKKHANSRVNITPKTSLRKFDRELCMVQLRYSGMMDTVRIRKLGYPIRHTFTHFLFRYRVLLNTAMCDPKTQPAEACCEAICKTQIRGKDQWKVGKSKIFLKN
ncbi:hypothetical protein CRUP_032098 [Coryphaenoides rupestris]|nr:hypothetical protein CRUP_032098 [Coryphaenoides rupestris]